MANKTMVIVVSEETHRQVMEVKRALSSTFDMTENGVSFNATLQLLVQTWNRLSGQCKLPFDHDAVVKFLKLFPKRGRPRMYEPTPPGVPEFTRADRHLRERARPKPGCSGDAGSTGYPA